jgi:hypothetical protein
MWIMPLRRRSMISLQYTVVWHTALINSPSLCWGTTQGTTTLNLQVALYTHFSKRGHNATKLWTPNIHPSSSDSIVSDYRLDDRVWYSELSSGIYCRVKWLSTDVSEVRTASIIPTLNIILAAVRTWNLTWTTGVQSPAQAKDCRLCVQISCEVHTPSIQWVPWVLPGRDADHSVHLMLRLRMSTSYISSPPWRLHGCSVVTLLLYYKGLRLAYKSPAKVNKSEAIPLQPCRR